MDSVDTSTDTFLKTRHTSLPILITYTRWWILFFISFELHFPSIMRVTRIKRLEKSDLTELTTHLKSLRCSLEYWSVTIKFRKKKQNKKKVCTKDHNNVSTVIMSVHYNTTGSLTKWKYERVFSFVCDFCECIFTFTTTVFGWMQK